MIIALDAGHYKHTPGKRTPDGIREWALNDSVCRYLAKELEQYGCKVLRVDDATGNTDVPLSTRRNKAVAAGAKLLLSIHHNAHTGSWGNATGTETFTATNTHKESRGLAASIAAKLSTYTGLNNRGAKIKSWTVIDTIKIPAILCEGGFMDNKKDYAILTSAEGQMAYAQAVADAVAQYYNLIKQEEEMTYEQFKLFMEQYNTEVATQNPSWGKDTWEEATQKNIVDGGRPMSPMTRLEYAVSELRRLDKNNV